ncbi:hypothetical protein POM88_051890 [Heracleum sosnowskyi]|uniref:Uncharacterized protein n=1 Tax=Heracleum sosnowskyi TaxID=360622 RepID=A0AAD8GQZ8_9APIA|nr:hypothetical protein POM88_051890 [Heracleum sosnowskyi]
MKLRIRKGVSTSLPFQQGRDIDELFNYAFKDGELGILGVASNNGAECGALYVHYHEQLNSQLLIRFVSGTREGPYRKRDRPECVIKAILDPRSSSRPEIHDRRPQTDDATASHTVPECGLNSAASTAQVLHEMIQLEPPLQFLHQTTIHL